METIFMLVLLVLVLLFYYANRKNTTNKWCAVAGFIFWLGIAKEAILFNVIPVLENILENETLGMNFMPVYSVATWALYSLAMPTTVIFSLYFSNLDNMRPETLRWLKGLLYVPALALSFFFPPLTFRAYQLTSLPFWITYAAYNLGLGVAFAFFMIKGVRIETNAKRKTQKRYIRLVVLPPVLFWMLSVFIVHPLQISQLYKLWEGNAVLLAVSLVVLIVMAFRDGFMGLKLTSQRYNWDTDMEIVERSAEYTSHMLKNQTAKMEWCVDNLKAQFDQAGETPPEELSILSRSISTLKRTMDSIKKHSETIVLLEEDANLKELLMSALPLEPGSVVIDMLVPDDVSIYCDKTHMIEVFVNILSNAMEAMRYSGSVRITGGFDQNGACYGIRFTDHGDGMSQDVVDQIFTPYFTTKNTEKNFGLGMTYCKNVAEKHNGHIRVESELGKGTTVTIELPSKRIMNGGREAEDSDG